MPLGRKLRREGAGEADDGVLGGGIGDLAGRAVAAPDGGHVDDAAGMLVQHVGQHRLDRVVAAAQVHRKDAVPGGPVDVLKKLLFGDARVVDEQRDLPELLFRARDHGLHGLGIGHVRLYPDGVGPSHAELFAQRLGQIRALDAVEADGIARPGQRLGAGRADPAGRAGDKRDLPHSAASSPRCAAMRLRQRFESSCVLTAVTSSTGMSSRMSSFTSVRRKGKFLPTFSVP